MLVANVIHDILYHKDAKSADTSLMDAKRDVGIALCERVEGDASVF